MGYRLPCSAFVRAASSSTALRQQQPEIRSPLPDNDDTPRLARGSVAPGNFVQSQIDRSSGAAAAASLPVVHAASCPIFIPKDAGTAIGTNQTALGSRREAACRDVMQFVCWTARARRGATSVVSPAFVSTAFFFFFFVRV